MRRRFAAVLGAALGLGLALVPLPAAALSQHSLYFWSARAAADSLARDGARPGLAIELGRPTWTGLEVIVPVRLARPIDPALRQMLLRGVPATCDVRVELWHARPRWFDRRLAAQTLSFRVRYDLWRERWHVRGPDGETTVADTLALDRMLGAWRHVRLVQPLGASARRGYYAAARARVAPLSAEDLEEMADWLAGGQDARADEAVRARPPVPRVPGVRTLKAAARTPVFYQAATTTTERPGAGVVGR